MADGPDIPGWDVERVDDERWLARRRGGLSRYQLDYGCRLIVGASSFGELELAVVAENIKATMTAAAEELARGMLEAELQRRADDRTTPSGGVNA